MKLHFVFIAALILGTAVAGPAHAQASFTVNSGQTVTTAQTLGAGQTGTVASGGTLNVSGSKNAIAVQGSATITNSGTIEQTGSARGIRDTGTDVGLTLSVTNNVGATLSAVADDAIEIQYGDDSVLFNNYGGVFTSGSSDQAINFNHVVTGSNTLNNFSTGHIETTAADAVRPGVNGVVNNDGKIDVITPSGDTSSSDGIDAQTNSGIAISNALIGGDPSNSLGIIEGERHGITGGNTSNTGNPIGLFTMSVTNAANFTIQGDNGAGINVDGVAVNRTTGAYDVDGNDPNVTSNELVVISNAGNIIGNGAARDGDGIDVDGLVRLTNSGTIRSQCAAGDTSEGVTVGGGTITNLAGGIIEGDNTLGKYNCNPVLNSVTGTGRGITLAGVDHDVNNNDAPIVPTQGVYGSTTVDNFGMIYGDSDSGIALTGAPSENVIMIVNEVGGTIEGAGATQAAVSVGTNAIQIFNSGTIKADNSGVAIDLGAGDNIAGSGVQIFGGSAHVIGNIVGSSQGNSQLSIMPNATYTYTANATYDPASSTGTGTTTITGTSNSFTYSNALSNFLQVLVDNGTTILTSSSVNTYTGNTIVQTNGILQLDGTIASGLTDVHGAVRGTGSFGGIVWIEAGANVYPGDTAGDVAPLNVGSLSLFSGSTATFDVGSAEGSNDSIVSSGAVSITAANLAINLPNDVKPGNYVLITGSGISGQFDAPTFSPALPSTMTATIAYSATAVTLQIQTISSISLQASQDPSVFGAPVTFTASVSGTAPTGAVTFFDGNTMLGTSSLSNGMATFIWTDPSTGFHPITAVYAGDSHNTPSTSAIFEQYVLQSASSVMVTASPNPSAFGQSVTITATVTGQSPTGTVTFEDGSTAICSAVALTGGIATCSTASLSVGTHAITATYNGDDNNLSSSSFGIVQTVQRATTSTAVSTACMQTFVENQPFTLTATVTGITPTGTVSFSDGIDSFCSNTPLSGSSASCTIDTLAVTGTETEHIFNLSASYSGDGNNLASSSAPLSINVLSADDVLFRNGFETDAMSCPIE